MHELIVERIHEGLGFYAQGRIEDAVRAWVDAKRVGAGPLQPSVDAYLAFVREILPAVHEALEAELGPFLEPPAPPPTSEPPQPIALPESNEPGGIVFDVDAAEIYATADLDAAPAPLPASGVALVASTPASVTPSAAEPLAAAVAAPAAVSAAAPVPAPGPVVVPAPVPTAAPAPRLPEIELDVPQDTAGESLLPNAAAPAVPPSKPASPAPVDRPRHGAARTPARAVVVRAAPAVARLVSTRTPIQPPPVVQAPVASPVAAPEAKMPSEDPWGGPQTIISSPSVDPIASGFSLVAPGNVSAVEPMQQAGAATELERQEARLTELEELDDFSGMLATAKAILAVDADHGRALAAQKRARERLSQMHESRIGSLDMVPTVLVAPDQVIWLDLDQRVGFILSQIDGFSSCQDILEISGMDRLEVLAILARLVEAKVIGPAPTR